MFRRRTLADYRMPLYSMQMRDIGIQPRNPIERRDAPKRPSTLSPSPGSALSSWQTALQPTSDTRQQHQQSLTCSHRQNQMNSLRPQNRLSSGQHLTPSSQHSSPQPYLQHHLLNNNRQKAAGGCSVTDSSDPFLENNYLRNHASVDPSCTRLVSSSSVVEGTSFNLFRRLSAGVLGVTHSMLTGKPVFLFINLI
ncbi:unnamed protein product [Protopolystoma xenopodis]|uniref:Uncharacterized protein n=1 Tax=Protopolystoma xenopodis TaxID=117903 RepID=A0A448X2D7_9PLAT|nr:unnamed protein product [Protopolystoma xenopodis]